MKNEANDAEIVARVRGGFRNDFEILVHRHYRTVRALALASSGGIEAEDVVQETWMQAFLHLDALRDGSKFGAWVASIARNIARRHIKRREQRQETPLDSASATGTVTPDMARTELRAQVRHQVAELPDPYRETIALHYFAGLSAKEIADTLGISRSAALKRLQRGRERLGEGLLALAGEEYAHDSRVASKAARVSAAAIALHPPWENTGQQATHASMRPQPKPRYLAWRLPVLAGAVVIMGAAALIWPSGGSSSNQETPEAATKTTTVPEIVSQEPALVPPAPEAPAAPSSPVSGPLTSLFPAPPGYPGTPDPGVTDNVEGRVEFPGGSPAANAKVWVCRSGGGGPPCTQEVLSDASGRFSFKVSEGQWRLRARKDAWGGNADLGLDGAFIVTRGRQDLVHTNLPGKAGRGEWTPPAQEDQGACPRRPHRV